MILPSNSDGIKLELSDRERRRYMTQLETLSKEALELRVAIEKNDDLEIIGNFLVFSLTMGALRELGEVVVEASKKSRDARIAREKDSVLDAPIIGGEK